jgi:hypothetical protein
VSPPQDFLDACHCSNSQEAMAILSGANDNETISRAAWQAVAMLAPPQEVHELFNSGQAPYKPYMIWQHRYDKHVAETLAQRSRENAEEHNLSSADQMLSILQDQQQTTARRIAAAYGLGDCKYRPAILSLIEMMGTEDFNFAFACSDAL